MAQDTSSLVTARWQALLWPGLLWAATVALLGLPLFRPHGPFLWGYYSFRDIYLGWPIALAALFATRVRLKPDAQRRLLALRLTALWLSIVGVALVMDIVYALFVVGAWKGDYWLDQAHITRRYSAPDAELGFVRKPNITWRGRLPGDERQVDYRTDERGFRNPPGLTRADLVFIGDSFTEAAQVAEDDTFARRLATTLRLGTVNLGRGAYGPQQELIVLRRYGLAYQPTLVVWQIFEGNDLDDAKNFARWRQQQPASPLSLRQRYLENSLLQLLLAGTRLPNEGDKFASLKFHDGTQHALRLRYRYAPQQPAEAALGFAETKQVLAEGQQMCRAQGVKLLVVYVPVMARVLEPWLSFDDPAMRARFLPAGGIHQSSDLGQQLAGFCVQQGIAFLDTFNVLRQRAEVDNRGLYIPSDEHLDVQGHKVLAQAIVQAMAEKLGLK
jgi:hypothetical protein